MTPSPQASAPEARRGPTSSSLEAAGHEVAVHRWGHGPPQVVLVHGIGVSHRYFVPLAEHLARDGVSVLALDLPGFGASPRPVRPLPIAEHANALAAVLDDVGGPAVVLGHSMGAQVVTELAVRRPDLVTGVVLVGAVADPGAPRAHQQGLRLLRDVRHEAPAATRLMIGDWLRCGPRWYLATVPEMVGYPIEERLGLVTAPVVLVRGGRDPVTPAGYLRHLADVRPGAVVDEVAGEGHIAMFRRPGRVARWCLDPVGGVRATSAPEDVG